MNHNYMMFWNLIKESRQIHMIIDPISKKIIDANEAAQLFYGYKDSITDMSYTQLCLDNEESINNLFKKLIKLQSYNFKSTHKNISGEEKYLEIYYLRIQHKNKYYFLFTIVDITELSILKNENSNNKDAIYEVLSNIPSISVKGFRTDGTLFYWNKGSEKLYGYTQEEAVGKNFIDLYIPNDKKPFIKDKVDSIVKNNICSDSIEISHIRKNGCKFDVASYFSLLNMHDKGLVLFCIDIDSSDRKAISHLKRSSNVFIHACEPILITDSDATIVDVNNSFVDTFGYRKKEVIGKNPNVIKSGVHSSIFYSEMWEKLNRHGGWSGEIYNKKKNGTIIPMQLRINTIKDVDGSVLNHIGFFSDLTHLKEYEIALKKAAFVDSLTELPNRVFLDKHLSDMINSPNPDKHLTAILYIDVDGFKQINDTYGHRIGDEVLKVISKRLKSQLRDQDVLARLGGDEFVAILGGFKHKSNFSIIVERLIEATKDRILIDNKYAIKTSVSIGISIYPEDSKITDVLLNMADKAMYVSKKEGKNRYSFYK